MRWPERAASNGYDLGRDAPFEIVRLPAHSSRLANVKRRPQAAPLFFSAAARGALRRLRQGGQIGLGGRKRALAVGPDRVEPFCPLKQHDRRLAVLSALVGEPDGRLHSFQRGGEGLLLVVELDRPVPLALEHDELCERHLVEPAEQPDQQDDGDRYPDQPEQKTSTHCVLLSGLPT